MKIEKLTRIILLLVLLSPLFVSGLKAQFGAKTHQFPHFAAGGGVITSFTIHEPGAAIIPINVDIQLYRSDGTSFLTDQVQLGRGETKTVSYGGSAGTTISGWAKLSSTSDFTATELFEIAALSNVGVVPVDANTQLKLFAFVTEGTNTGFAIANPSDAVESVLTVQMFNNSGSLQGEAVVTLSPLEHMAVFLDEAPFLMDMDGTVTISATQPILALTLRLDGTKLASVPVITPTQVVLGVGSIVTSNLADGAVTFTKIADGAVTNSKIAEGAVTFTKIADGHVTRTKIANGAVGSAQIANFITLGTTDSSGGGLRTTNDTGTEVSFLGVTPIGGGLLTVSDSSGNEVVQLGANTGERGLFHLLNSKGNLTVVSGSTTDDFGLLVLNDPSEDAIVVLGGSVDNVGGNVAVVSTTGTTVAAMAPTTSGGHGAVSAYNSTGNITVVLSATATGHGFVTVNDSSGIRTAGIDGTTGIVFGNFKSFIVPDPTNSDRKIKYTSLEGPEAAIYFRGTTTLASGITYVQFPDHFAAMAVPSSITVTLTPRSAISMGLAAINVTADSVEVVELNGGSGTYRFDYVVHAVRKGSEDYQVYLSQEEAQQLTGSAAAVASDLAPLAEAGMSFGSAPEVAK